MSRFDADCASLVANHPTNLVRRAQGLAGSRFFTDEFDRHAMGNNAAFVAFV